MPMAPCTAPAPHAGSTGEAVRQAATMSGRDRGVRDLPPLGAGVDRAWPRGEADAGAVCEAGDTTEEIRTTLDGFGAEYLTPFAGFSR